MSLKSILIISCVFPPEPVVSAQISKDLALALKAVGKQVTILVPFPSRPAGFNFQSYKSGTYYQSNLPGVEIVNLNSKISPRSRFHTRFAESYSFGAAVVRYLDKNSRNFDLVYMNSWPIISQYLIAKTCKRLRIPYVTHIQDIYPESLSNRLPFILGRLINAIFLPLDKFHLRNANKIIAVSENMKCYLKKSRGIIYDKLTVIYNWQDESHFFIHNGSLENNSKFTFMYLGNIGPVAGVETLIRAFHLADLKNCNLIIAGNGANKLTCVDLASSFKLSNILFKDVPGGDVAKVQQQADALLLPVIRGGALSSIPSKLPAYMFSAKPIIATLDEQSDTAKAILEAGCGWVGPPEDEEWLANQMKIVYNLRQEELCRLGKKGFDYGSVHFSKKANLEKLLKVILDE